MMFLKQSTASQTVILGPFVDSTDGNTQETGLTIANTDIKLSKNGGTIASKASGGATHDANGWYAATLDATDTNTVGRLQLYVHVAGALAVVMEFQVVEEAVYDGLFGASATGAALTGLASATDLATVAGYLDTEVAAILAAVDTEVAAIKAKTDSLTFTVAGQVDSNIQSINDVTVLGDGSATPWGP